MSDPMRIFCSQCGRCFGEGPRGFSHCADHTADEVRRRREEAAKADAPVADVEKAAS